MLWGTFSLNHFISLLIAVLLNVSIFFILKDRTLKTKKIVLFILSLSGLGAIIFNLVAWGSPLEYLPLHMCSINALLLPFAVLTQNKKLSNMLLLWCLGAGIALILNQGAANFEILSWTFFFYYIPHTLELGIPILIFALKLSELDYKTLPFTLITTFLIYTGVHFSNLLINYITTKYNIVDQYGNIIIVNYMFSITPTNPVLAIFYKIIPYRYWYMLLSLFVISLYLGIIYGIHYKIKKSQNKLSND
ncbi:MAG: hypothetical protein ACI311_03500 [Bacilli bacterium]